MASKRDRSYPPCRRIPQGRGQGPGCHHGVSVIKLLESCPRDWPRKPGLGATPRPRRQTVHGTGTPQPAPARRPCSVGADPRVPGRRLGAGRAVLDEAAEGRHWDPAIRQLTSGTGHWGGCHDLIVLAGCDTRPEPMHIRRRSDRGVAARRRDAADSDRAGHGSLVSGPVGDPV